MANLDQPEPKSHSFGIIHMEESNGGTAAGRNAFDESTIQAKMALPFLFVRMEKNNYFL